MAAFNSVIAAEKSLEPKSRIPRLLCACAASSGSEDAAIAKWSATEVQGRVLDRCVQLHGGYGYMAEYPIARAYADARVQTIYGGTSEIMKTIIARDVTGLRA